MTINCSMVPRSRSRTTAVAVSNAVMKDRIMPITPGILKYAEIRSGLYQTWVRTSTGGVNPAGCALRAVCSPRIFVAKAWPISCAAESAVPPTVASDPSSTIETWAFP